jgi:hypothetical protein
MLIFLFVVCKDVVNNFVRAMPALDNRHTSTLAQSLYKAKCESYRGAERRVGTNAATQCRKIRSVSIRLLRLWEIEEDSL